MKQIIQGTRNTEFRIPFLLFSFLLFSFSVCAQKDAKAKELLDKSSAAFSSAGDVSAYFTMEIKDVTQKVSEAFDGSIEMKGSKFHIDIPESEIWFDGKTQWVLQKSWDEVNVSEPSGQEVQALNPAMIYTLYKKGCSCKYLGEKTDVKKRKVQEIELIPQNKTGDITKIVMQVNALDFMPVMIRISFSNKIENIIHINTYKTKQNFPDSTFAFNKKKYPDAEIIDLR
jgi:outer membrane lipoprotein-sorting protein